MKALIFLGPAHHYQIIGPIARELESRDWKTDFYSANAESSFEVGILSDLGKKDWHWLPDYRSVDEENKLYHEGVDYFREIYTSSNPFSLMIPPIADRILKEIAVDWYATRNLLEKLRPDVCLTLHELNRWGMILSYWSAVKRIPIFTFQEGMYYGDDWIYKGHTRYSTSLVWGEAAKNKLTAGGSPADRVVVIGHPDLADRAAAARVGEQAAWEKLPPEWKGKKIVLMFMTSVTISMLVADNLLAGIEQSDYRIILHVHVLAALTLRNQLKEIFKDHLGKTIVISEDFNSLWPFLTLSSCVAVMGCSTLGLEALYLGKPLVELWAPGQAASFAKDYGVATDGVNRPLLESVTEAVKQNTFSNHVQKVQKFVKHYIQHPNAAKQIADHIEKEVKRASR